MKKKLLFGCALLALSASSVMAQSEEPVWHMTTDSQQYIPLAEVEYLMFVDNSELFSIVKSNGDIITEVRYVGFDNIPLAVEEIGNDCIDIAIFPNPVVSEIRLQGLKSNSKAQVFSLDGATLMETIVTPQQASINVSSLATGIYMLKVNETTVKFIKK